MGRPEPRTDEEPEAAARPLAAAGPWVKEPSDLPEPPLSNRPSQRPLGDTDVCVNDFIQLGQGSRRRLNALRNHSLHAADEVLSRPLPEEKRNKAASLKKLLKGDGS